MDNAKSRSCSAENDLFGLDPEEIFLGSSTTELPKQIKAIGIKVFYEHLEEKYWQPFWNVVTKDKEIKIIHLFREDQQKAFESFEKSLKRKSMKKMELVLEQYSFHTDDDIASKFFSRLERGKWMVEALFDDANVLPITYEDLIKKRSEVFLKIQEFLQVPYKELYSPLKRIRTY